MESCLPVAQWRWLPQPPNNFVDVFRRNPIRHTFPPNSFDRTRFSPHLFDNLIDGNRTVDLLIYAIEPMHFRTSLLMGSSVPLKRLGRIEIEDNITPKSVLVRQEIIGRARLDRSLRGACCRFKGRMRAAVQQDWIGGKGPVPIELDF
jgi:hypothetical protein